jgi:protocatechuate 3,4-dioxygenase beta subunit
MWIAAAWATLQGVRIEGTVRSAEREPAVRAQVFASRQGLLPPYDPVTLAKAETDRDGRFVLVLPQDWVQSPHFKHVALWAWMPGRAISARAFEATEIPAGDPVALTLGPPASRPLRILDADGKPVVGASVAPISVDLGESQEQLPTELVDLIAARTKEEGRVTIDAWQLPSVSAWRVESGIGGTQQVQNFDRGPREWAAGELKLAPVGRVAVNVEQEAAGDAPSAAIRVQSFASTGAPGGRSTRGIVRGTICVGRAELGTLVAGDNLVEIECDPDSQIRPVLWPVKVEAGRTAELTVRWKPGHLVKGRVVERGTSTPIPNVRLSWFQYPCGRRTIVTDAEGRFHVRAFGGAAAIEDVDAPSPYLGVHDFGVFHYMLDDDEKEQELPDIGLVRATSLHGVVLDAKGDPAPAAWIAAKWQSSSAGRFRERFVASVADDRGRFVLDPVEDDASLEIVARSGAASSGKPERVKVGKSIPIELRIESQDSVSLRGRVLDQDGRPVTGAEIETWRASPENVIGGEKLVGSVITTGVDGRFQTTRDLSRGELCCVRVSAPGKVLQRSAWMRASAEGPLEIVLPSLARLTGSVHASDGTPVIGARIAVCGDAPQPTESRTDDQGRFSLDAILPGQVFLMLEADGRRLGRIADTSGGTLDWKLDDTESPLRTLPPLVARERELEIAQKVLDPRVRKAIESKKPDDIFRALMEQAWVAPELALAPVEAGAIDGYRADYVRIEAATRLLTTRIDDAIAVMGLLQDSYCRAHQYVRMAESVPENERQRKVDLLTEAAVRAQEVQDPAHRLTTLSYVAVNLFRLGDRDSARKIIEGAASIAESLPTEEWAGFARGRFAEALCLFDLDRALAIVDGLKDSFARVRHRGNIAHRLAALDPEAAERVLCTQLRKNQSRDWDRWIPRVCHDMAPVDRVRALALADTTDDSDRAQALGWIALAIAHSDPAAANALLDKAIGPLRGEISRVVGSNAAATAASLLPIVEQIDSSRVREFLWAAMSLRSPRPVQDLLQREQQSFAADAQLALLVARYDREVARGLLSPLVEHLKLGDPHRYSDWATDALPAALAVTDPEWALSLVGTLLPERASSTIAAVLARSGEERWRFVQDKYLNLWVVGKEDL